VRFAVRFERVLATYKKNDSGNDQTKKNSDDAIANIVEIGIGREI
jgi:hypothetical protein